MHPEYFHGAEPCGPCGPHLSPLKLWDSPTTRSTARGCVLAARSPHRDACAARHARQSAESGYATPLGQRHLDSEPVQDIRRRGLGLQ